MTYFNGYSLRLHTQSSTKTWFLLVRLQFVFHGVFSVSVLTLIGALTWRSRYRKPPVPALSACATFMKLAAFFPDRQRNAFSMPLSHHSLTTVTTRQQITLPVYSEYTSRLIMRRPRCDSATLVTRTPQAAHCVQSWLQATCIQLQSHALRRASVFVWTRVPVSTEKTTALCEQQRVKQCGLQASAGLSDTP